MDYFTNKKFIFGVITGLLFLNLVTLSIFWFRFFEPKPPFPSPHFQKPRMIDDFLKNELKLNEQQLVEFNKLRIEHFEKAKIINENIHLLKNVLLKEVLKPKVDSISIKKIIDEIAFNQAELERITFLHFLNLKSICKDEQIENFNSLILEIIRTASPERMHAPPPPLFIQPLN